MPVNKPKVGDYKMGKCGSTNKNTVREPNYKTAPVSRFTPLLLLITALTIIALSFYAWQMCKQSVSTEHEHHRMIELNGVITHLDEVLTMSAKMAAATGDLDWENRHRTFETQLDAAIKEAKNLTPLPAVTEAAEQTDIANIKLVAMENNAFELVRQGNLHAAAELLNSNKYQKQKRIYADGVKQSSLVLQKHMKDESDKHRRAAFGAVTTAVFVSFLIIYGWLTIIQVRKNLTERRRTEKELERLLHNRQEQVKELACMYGVADTIRKHKNLEPIFRDVTALIPTGWRHPEITRAKINFDRAEYTSEPFEQTPWKQTSDIIINGERRGSVEVYYLQERPELDEGPFLKEERNLINGIAHTLSEAIERKQAEQRQARRLKKLESINKELNDFAYIISHDLKAPLRGIKSLVNWISTDYSDKIDQQGKEQIGLLSSRVDRMHNLIDGVLQYSRAGRIRSQKSPIDLNKLVPEIINTLNPPENITITIENQLPVIVCEQVPATQLFQNLLSNAVKYMDKPEGQIKINCSEQDDLWKFSVADNGPGIKQEHFEKIFQIFQTLAPRDELESTGVGLAVVKKIVETNGGRIWLKSELGIGSTFFFTFPKQQTELAHTDQTELQPAATS